VFKRTGFKQPLKIDIHKDVLAHYAQYKRFTPKRLCKAIRLYIKGKAYLKTLKEGADRIDLEGKVVDKVTKKQAVYANNLLKVKRFMSTQKYLKKPNSTFQRKNHHYLLIVI
jgi:ProP effector